MDMEEYRQYESLKAMNRLMTALESGRRSGETQGWLDADKVFSELERQYDA